ncbi:signal peptide peptidase SppA, 67K type [Luminiphilus syltensis NOR5-1B]|uniref:Signal peptide peptidase SppA, 67K type n=2 Tax=Luminiphilus TaxID=1341118 RepID=B8KQB8_9GAMM|nr:signal peptide peptidase SppA, 67K type [Luminiphilus syltensis NOR5-1B]
MVPLVTLGALIYMLSIVFDQARPMPIEDNSVLLLQPVGVVVEDLDPLEPLQALLQQDVASEVLLSDLVDAIDAASEDPRISAMVIDLADTVGPGLSQTLDLITAIDRFKARGKPVIAVGDFYTQGHYLVASQADEVLLHPKGSLSLTGFGAYNYYLVRLLDKIKLTVHVFRAGDNKSAVEPFLRDDMSSTERRVVARWLGSLWQDYTAVIERGRGLPSGSIDRMIADFPALLGQYGGDVAQMSLALGLIDGLANDAAMEARIAEVAGAGRDEVAGVFYDDYLNTLAVEAMGKLPVAGADQPALVAVVPIEGELVPGESIDGFAGSETVLERLRRTAELPGLEAVVLRINTPGGSVFAADVIREGVQELRAQGLTVVVSMAALATSGGYYIAAETDHIVAQPTTLTGSIGVFAAFPTFERLFDYAGVSVDGVGTTAMADAFRADRPLSEGSASVIRQVIAGTYVDFLHIVAEGRGMNVEQVAPIAEGIVWTGSDALEIGLVDSMGGLEEAINIAAGLAGLDRWEVQRMGTAMSPEQRLLQHIGRSIGMAGVFSAGPIADMVDALRPPLRLVESFKDPQGVYMRCISCANVL